MLTCVLQPHSLTHSRERKKIKKLVYKQKFVRREEEKVPRTRRKSNYPTHSLTLSHTHTSTHALTTILPSPPTRNRKASSTVSSHPMSSFFSFSLPFTLHPFFGLVSFRFVSFVCVWYLSSASPNSMEQTTGRARVCLWRTFFLFFFCLFFFREGIGGREVRDIGLSFSFVTFIVFLRFTFLVSFLSGLVSRCLLFFVC